VSENVEVEAFTLTFQRGMEEETSSSNENVANEGNQKDGVMTVLQAIPYAFAGKVHEQ
jgi:hypothetical protein